FDMDGQHEPNCLYKFIDLITSTSTENKPDIISGSRYQDKTLFWEQPWKDRFLVNTIITAVFRTIGLEITDSFCGMKAHHVERVNKLDLSLDGYEMPIEMLIKAFKKGYEISELAVPVIYKNRDDALKKNKSKTFMFKSAENRIKKYLGIIKMYYESGVKATLDWYVKLFDRYYNAIEQVTPENYLKIQRLIFKEVEVMKS
ncbi:MAG: hypothetical protein ACTSRA_20485, partial [Promethearchaeota archaeon]